MKSAEESRCCALQGSLQTRKSRLSRTGSTPAFRSNRGADTPRLKGDLVQAFGEFHLVLVGEQVPRGMEVASVVASGRQDLGGRVGRGAAPYHNRAYRIGSQKTGDRCRRSSGRGLAGEEIPGSRKNRSAPCSPSRRRIWVLSRLATCSRGLVTHRCCRSWCWWE